MCQLSHFSRLSLLLVGAQFALASAAWSGQPASNHRAPTPVAKKHQSPPPKTGLNSAVARQPITSDPIHGKAPKSIAPKFEPPKLTGNTGKSLTQHGGPLPNTGNAQLAKTPTTSLSAPAGASPLAARLPDLTNGGRLSLSSKQLRTGGDAVDPSQESSGNFQALTAGSPNTAQTPPSGGGSAAGGGAAHSGGTTTNAAGGRSRQLSDGSTIFYGKNGTRTLVRNDGTYISLNGDTSGSVRRKDGSTVYFDKNGKVTVTKDKDGKLIFAPVDVDLSSDTTSDQDKDKTR
jgi:hypothetical protein